MKKLIFVFLLLSVSFSFAQTKTSGVLDCKKPDPQYLVVVGDHANHALELEQAACTWTKPMEISAIQTKDGVSTSNAEMDGDKFLLSGFHVSNMANGDKIFVKFHGSAVIKDGKPGPSSGTWEYTGGTGRLTGIKGKGTFKGAPGENNSTIFQIDGDFMIAPGK